jgi:molecular chaperone DnaK
MNYVGIDLGTSNSAICSYDGENVHLYKSAEQNDVTPSAIFIDRRGNKYLGQRAYDSAARYPDNAATKFKRFMGTSTPMSLKAVGKTLTPEECSAEVLKLCFGYLPEDIRNNPETATVITVPAAFNQMQKDATMSAAEMAGLGKVALMQEPVAAVMSVMRQRKADGVFLVYDLGGGTLDIAIAQSISSRVSLLAHGGIAMCGGADFDRAILDNIAKPWLIDTFDLPNDFAANAKYKPLLRLALWACEKAKIELSGKDEVVISLPETDIGIRDESDEEMYLDIPFSRQQLDALIAPMVEDTISAARETLEKAGQSPNDVSRIVFVGGPTNYKPLRDKVSTELGIAASTEVNPMTAVAEGAAIFAESIDWSSQSRGRKSARGAMSAGGSLNLSFRYNARTPDTKAKIRATLAGNAAQGTEFQVDSLDTGWSSGRIALQDGATVDLLLLKPGENAFKVFVFDATGGTISLGQDKIVITRTAATVDAIPASHSIAVAARQKIGGPVVPIYFVREGDQLPKKGREKFKAEESLKAGSANSLNFQFWEGEIAEPIADNRLVGMFKIEGTDFDEGVIAAGADLICDYEVLDSGNIFVAVSVPSIGSSFHSGRNFYSRQGTQIDYSQASKLVADQVEGAEQRLNEMAEKIEDTRLDQAREKLDQASSLQDGEGDPENAKHALDNVQEAKRLLALARDAHLTEIRQLDLDKVIEYFNESARKHARPSEASTFDNLCKTAQRSIEGGDFEAYLSDLWSKCFGVLWRQDWFVIDRFKWLEKATYLFPDLREHAALVCKGTVALNSNDIEALRKTVWHLDSIRFKSASDTDMLASINIIARS